MEGLGVAIATAELISLAMNSAINRNNCVDAELADT